jgi:hypothetical protein
MRARLVRPSKRRQVEATSLMSDYIELINPQTRICKLLKNGEVVAEYKMEQCDKCSMLARADEFGYQRGQRGEKLMWFCGGCR